jgi:hypothetical protein
MSAQDFKPYIHMTPTAVSVSATGEITNPVLMGYPVTIRQFHVMPLVSGLNYATALGCRLMIQSLASGSTASAVCTVTGASGDIAGKLIVKKNLNTVLRPGSRVFVNNDSVVTGAPTAHFGIVVEPKWEEPENFTSARVLT